MRSPRLLREARKRGLDAAIRAQRRLRPRVFAAFHHLLATVQARTTVLATSRVPTTRARRFVDALVTIAAHRGDWLRELDAWTPPTTASAEVVLVSLVEHLFALFPVPRFMTAAWLGTDEQRRWYIRLGAGASVRVLGLPVPVSRRMAHAFRASPDDLSILGAIRWAQVRGLGGSFELARAVAMTRLGRERGDEAFFGRVIAFLVEVAGEGDLDRGLVALLVDAILARGAAPEGLDLRADVARCAVGRRTRTCILHDWGGRPAPGRLRPTGLTWKPAPFAGLRAYPWRIAELCTSEELRQEGIAMRHCVATYAAKCAYGSSSIWSMTVEEEGQLRRAVTIEVNVKRRLVCQVKGHANRRPKDRFVEVLRRWAAEQGLSIAVSNIAPVRAP